MARKRPVLPHNAHVGALHKDCPGRGVVLRAIRLLWRRVFARTDGGAVSTEDLAEEIARQWRVSGLGQHDFARRYNQSAKTLRHWMAGRRLRTYVDFIEGMRANGVEFCAIAAPSDGNHGSHPPLPD